MQRAARIRDILKGLGPDAVCSELRAAVTAEMDGYKITDAQFYNAYRQVFGYNCSQRKSQANGKGVVCNESVQSLRGISPAQGVSGEGDVTSGGAGEGPGHVPVAEPAFVTPTAPPVHPSDELDELIEVRDFCRRHGGVVRTATLVNLLKVLVEGTPIHRVGKG